MLAVKLPPFNQRFWVRPGLTLLCIWPVLPSQLLGVSITAMLTYSAMREPLVSDIILTAWRVSFHWMHCQHCVAVMWLHDVRFVLTERIIHTTLPKSLAHRWDWQMYSLSHSIHCSPCRLLIRYSICWADGMTALADLSTTVTPCSTALLLLLLLLLCLLLLLLLLLLVLLVQLLQCAELHCFTTTTV